MWNFFKSRRRERLRAEPLQPEWRAIIDRNLPLYARLSAAEQDRLNSAIKIIVAERSFVGIQGFVVTNEVKITVAAQAGLLLLGEEGYYYERVPTIFVQSELHRTRRVHPLGGAVLVEEGVLAEGQALEQGEVRLTWSEVLDGAADPYDGENVVLHEFAHHLDGLDGDYDGIPPLASAPLRKRWPLVFDRELKRLRAALARGRATFLHEEAAYNRAELFAYSTECYFEQPYELAELHPELFDCLEAFYKVDPRTWPLDADR